MDMSVYLTEIEHAASETLSLIWAEHRAVKELESLVVKYSREMEEGYRKASYLAGSDDPEDVMMGVGEHWSTYFGADKDHHETNKELANAQNRLQAREFSRSSVSGGLLQYAKQGISIVHSGLNACPDGRQIGSQILKQVIWQGRNQSIHWEEGNVRQSIQQCFLALAAEQSQEFSQFNAKNLAFEIVNLLGWVSFDKFANDMRSIA